MAINGAPGGFSLTNLSVSVNITGEDLGNISIQLVSPGGVTATLLKNANTQTATSSGSPAVITVATTTSTTQGAAEPNNSTLQATFNDDANKSVFKTAGTTGPTNFTIDGSALGNTLTSIFGGLGNVNGQWKLVINNFATGATGTVNSVGLSINGVTIGSQKNVATLAVSGNVRGATNAGNFPNAGSTLAVPNRGIDPAPAIASDNTLGTFSQFQGRIYVAYVDPDRQQHFERNPADNTDIFLLASDDGGTTWPAPRATWPTIWKAEQVNDDNSQTDGFSESDRPQFEPNLAVDPASGMLAVSFFDARNDAARARVATYVGTSIDGGASFSPETYVNLPQQAIDEATNAVITLGPIPDNESSAGGIADAAYNYGDHQALLFNNGNLMPFWASNVNGGTGTTANALSQITIAHATAAVGPRVVSVTEGPVGTTYGPVADTLNPDPSTTAGPSLGKFEVGFDRPVDVNSFLARDVHRDHVPQRHHDRREHHRSRRWRVHDDARRRNGRVRTPSSRSAWAPRRRPSGVRRSRSPRPWRPTSGPTSQYWNTSGAVWSRPSRWTRTRSRRTPGSPPTSSRRRTDGADEPERHVADHRSRAAHHQLERERRHGR